MSKPVAVIVHTQDNYNASVTRVFFTLDSWESHVRAVLLPVYYADVLSIPIPGDELDIHGTRVLELAEQGDFLGAFDLAVASGSDTAEYDLYDTAFGVNTVEVHYAGLPNNDLFKAENAKLERYGHIGEYPDK